MRAIQITQYVSDPADLSVTTLQEPIPTSGQYLIEVHAAAMNFFDILQIQGKYQHQPTLPWIAGCEFAGIVIATPSSNRNPAYAIGSRVFGAAQGGFSTHVCALETQLRPVPSGWSFRDAAGLMITAPTAYSALVIRAAIKGGDCVLIHAAAGGVGLAAVQVAKALGATVIATAGSKEKLEVAKNFGADHSIDYSEPGWEDAVTKLTPKGRGVDIVFDPVGMVNPSLRCTAWNGKIVVVGFAAGNIERVAMNRILLKNVSLVGLHWGEYARQEAETVEEVWTGLFKLIEDGKFTGTIFKDREFKGLDNVGEALSMLGGRQTWGKVVIEVPHGCQNKL